MSAAMHATSQGERDAATAPSRPANATLTTIHARPAETVALATRERLSDERRAQARRAFRKVYTLTCETCGATSQWRRRRAAAIEADAKTAKAAKARVTA